MSDITGPLDEMIAATPDWRGETVARLREIIRTTDPEMGEDVKWRRPSNPLGAGLFTHSGVVCFVGILKDRVRLTMNYGSLLPVDGSMFNAMLNGKSRAIDFVEGDKLDAKALGDLIRAGVEFNLAKAAARKK